jgi:hypothetical protein
MFLTLDILFGMVASVAAAQAIPAAIRPITEQAGIGFSYAHSDIGPAYIKGITGFGDVMYHNRIGLEADVHIVSLVEPVGVGEDTYLLGPKFALIKEDRMRVYVKGLAGIGRVDFHEPRFPDYTATYGVYAIGGGIEFRASPHINIRCADLEQQWWRSYPPHGLAPLVVTFGAAYRF